jgi:hypothetical protein
MPLQVSVGTAFVHILKLYTQQKQIKKKEKKTNPDQCGLSLDPALNNAVP